MEGSSGAAVSGALPSAPRALVFGGTGHVGSAVVKALSARGVGGAFTFLRSAERASALAAEAGLSAISLDMRDAAAIRRVIRDALPDIFVHCATHADPSRLD